MASLRGSLDSERKSCEKLDSTYGVVVMKPILMTLFLFAVSSAYSLDIPSYVFEFSELEEAKAEAIEDGKPIIFLNTETKKSLNSFRTATSAVMDEFRSVGTIVLLNASGGGLRVQEKPC